MSLTFSFTIRLAELQPKPTLLVWETNYQFYGSFYVQDRKKLPNLSN